MFSSQEREGFGCSTNRPLSSAYTTRINLRQVKYYCCCCCCCVVVVVVAVAAVVAAVVVVVIINIIIVIIIIIIIIIVIMRDKHGDANIVVVIIRGRRTDANVATSRRIFFFIIFCHRHSINCKIIFITNAFL